MWKKLGLVYSSDKHVTEFKVNSGLTPEPIVIGDIIRVYYSARDLQGRGRIFFADFDPNKACKLINVSEEPCLELGGRGEFDENGQILGSVELTPEGKYRMYFVGFQLPQIAKFYAFTGVAESSDGIHFVRMKNYAVEREYLRSGTTIAAIHTSFIDGRHRRFWYAYGDGWQKINDKDYPRYYIKTFSIDKSENDQTIYDYDCVFPVGDEYRIGRPKVYKTSRGKYVMYMTFGTIDGVRYEPTVAVSKDGLSWERRHDLLKISKDNFGWDSKHLCYPALAFYKNKVFMFYNGNDMGVNGFGAAEMSISEWEQMFL